MRNKPQEPPKKTKNAPFFLPTVAGLEHEFDLSAGLEDEAEEAEKVKRQKLADSLLSLSPFGGELQKSSTKKECKLRQIEA